MQLKVRILTLIEKLRNSYWFVPALLAFAGFAAGLGLVYVDALLGIAWLGQFEWFYASRPEGARSLLSTVAGSTITVAGVVFSVTLAAVTYASGQYGPRLLSNFVRDRGNQTSLGVFIGTFLYCLVVLRTIRSAEEASADTAGAVREAFVPNLAILGALGLAISSIGVLIYFVHHVTDTIHINNVIARIGRGLLRDIAEADRSAVAGGSEERATEPSAGLPVRSTKTGYIEALDEDALLAIAAEHGLTITVTAIPGDFVHRGRPLLHVEPGREHILESCGDVFSIGRKRSSLQDLRFAIDELVEIAARALSPGVNDPFTAFACIDWLGATLADLATMPKRPAVLRDHDGTGRVICRRLAFADYVHTAISQLRPYAVRDPNVAAHLLETLETLAAELTDTRDRDIVNLERERIRAEMRAKGTNIR